jgi:hypothetical protein
VSSFDLMEKVVNAQRPSFEEGCPKEYRFLVEKCWSQSPKDRPDISAVNELLLKWES